MYLFRLRKIEQIDFILSAESADRKKKIHKRATGGVHQCFKKLFTGILFSIRD